MSIPRSILDFFGRLRPSALDAVLFAVSLVCMVQVAVSVGFFTKIVSLPISTNIDLCYDLSMGYIVSYIFYLLVVAIPEFRSRRDLRIWLEADYRRFKRALIEIYLSAIGDPWEENLPETLLDAQSFSDYFNERYNATQTRWHAVHNGLYEYGFPQIIVECELFVREIHFARHRAKNVRSIPLDRLSAISRMLTRVGTSQPDYDDIKRILLVLFPIHCPWSVLDGDLTKDSIKESIGQL